MASLVFGLALGVVGTVGNSSAIADQPATVTKVTICHATASESNPYIRIKVAPTAVNGNNKEEVRGDHLNHTGPVWYPGAKAAGVTWGDIIPPVAGVTPGLNWPEGQSIFDNKCKLPTTTPTTVKAPSTTVKAPSTTVKAPTTTVKAPTTTVKAPSTTVKATTTTAVLSGGQTTTTVKGGAQTTTTAVLSSGGTVPGTEGIPKTGRDSSGMLLLGGVFVIFGAMLLGLTRRSAIR